MATSTHDTLRDPGRLPGFVCLLLLVGIGSSSLVGCGSSQPIDPRKYFSRKDPLETVVSFSWSVAARKWEHVSDCLAGDPESPLPKAALRDLGELEVGTDRALADVSVAADGLEAVVVVPFRDDFAPPNGRDAFTVYLESAENVEGVRLWRIDAVQTLEANARAEEPPEAPGAAEPAGDS